MIQSIFIWLMLNLNGLHPFHVSVCEIDLDAESKSLEITHHIFLDDFEQALRKKYDPVLDIVNPKNKEDRDRYVKEYIMDHFSVEVDGKLQPGKYLGHEIEEDAMYCFVEIDGIKKMKSISVKNNIMMELFDDQINLVHVKVDGKIKSMKLDRRTESGQITYGD